MRGTRGLLTVETKLTKGTARTRGIIVGGAHWTKRFGPRAIQMIALNIQGTWCSVA